MQECVPEAPEAESSDGRLFSPPLKSPSTIFKWELVDQYPNSLVFHQR